MEKLIFLIRWLRGSTRIKLCGAGAERLFKLAKRRNIAIWSAVRCGGSLVLIVSSHQANEVCRLAESIGVCVQECRHSGVPAIFRIYRGRVGFFVGAGMVLVLPFILSQFVLNISVEGNRTVDSIDIVRTLEEMGLKKFTLASSHDTRSMERKLLIKLKQLSFASVTVRGATVEVKVREGLPEGEILDTDTPSNILSATDAKIVETRVFEGHKQINVGDSVQKGQLLVSGIMEDKYGKNRLVRSRGEIIGETHRKLTETVPNTSTVYTHTATATVTKLFWNDKTVFTWGNAPQQDAKVVRRTYKFSVFGKAVPSYIVKEIYLLRDGKTQNIDMDTAKSIVEDRIARYVKKENIYLLKSTEFTATETDNSYIFDAVLVCHENIADEVKILSQEYNTSADK